MHVVLVKENDRWRLAHEVPLGSPERYSDTEEELEAISLANRLVDEGKQVRVYQAVQNASISQDVSGRFVSLRKPVKR